MPTLAGPLRPRVLIGNFQKNPIADSRSLLRCLAISIRCIMFILQNTITLTLMMVGLRIRTNNRTLSILTHYMYRFTFVEMRFAVQ